MIFHEGPFLTCQRDKVTLALLKPAHLTGRAPCTPTPISLRAPPGAEHPRQGSRQVENLLRRGAVCLPKSAFPQGKPRGCKGFLGSPRPRTGGPNPSSSRAWRPGNLGPGLIHCFELPVPQHPHLSALRPQRESAGWDLPGAFSPRVTRGETGFACRTLRWGERVGRGTGPGHPSRWGRRQSRPQREQTWARIRFPLHQRMGSSLRRKNKERKSARAFVLVFRLFASQLKSGRLGDSFAVFTV